MAQGKKKLHSSLQLYVQHIFVIVSLHRKIPEIINLNGRKVFILSIVPDVSGHVHLAPLF